MNANNTGITTLSVRQLANLIGRSEQTVRRWNDQGKLIAGLPAGMEGSQPRESGGGLVFTVDAVREFVQKNPRLLDKAKPELIELLSGNQTYVRRDAGAGRTAGKSAAKAGAAAAATALLGAAAFPVVVGGAALNLAGKLLNGGEVESEPPLSDSGYLGQLLQAREAEVRKQMIQLQDELTQIEGELSRDLPRSEYICQLLQARQAEIHRVMDTLQQELDQIKAEKTDLTAGE